MTTNSNWTVIFEDKSIIKNTGAEAGTPYTIDDNAFWATADFQNIWAIQSGTTNSSDEVEHRDNTPHCSLDTEGVSIQQFIDKWDAAHLAKLQSDWDNDDGNTYDAEGNVTNTETEAEKISRLGARPTSYSS
jgi:hypothetical protein